MQSVSKPYFKFPNHIQSILTICRVPQPYTESPNHIQVYPSQTSLRVSKQSYYRSINRDKCSGMKNNYDTW